MTMHIFKDELESCHNVFAMREALHLRLGRYGVHNFIFAERNRRFCEMSAFVDWLDILNTFPSYWNKIYRRAFAAFDPVRIIYSSVMDFLYWSALERYCRPMWRASREVGLVAGAIIPVLTENFKGGFSLATSHPKLDLSPAACTEIARIGRIFAHRYYALRPCLTVREMAILTCLSEGRERKEICGQLGIGVTCLREQLQRLYRKTGTKSDMTLALFASKFFLDRATMKPIISVKRKLTLT